MKENRPEKDENDGIFRKLGLFGIILGDLIGFTGAGIALGYLAWTKWGAPGWVVGVTGGVGMAIGFYRIYCLSKREL